MASPSASHSSPSWAGVWEAAQLDAEANWLTERRRAVIMGAMMTLVFSGEQFHHPKDGEWDNTDSSHTAGQPILNKTHPGPFGLFKFFHGVVFLYSFLIIALQFSGFRCLRGRAMLWLLTLLLWVDMLVLILAIYTADAFLTDPLSVFPIRPQYLLLGVVLVVIMIVIHVGCLCFAIAMYLRRAT